MILDGLALTSPTLEPKAKQQLSCQTIRVEGLGVQELRFLIWGFRGLWAEFALTPKPLFKGFSGFGSVSPLPVPGRPSKQEAQFWPQGRQ